MKDMDMKTIPLFYFPPTVMVIDDDDTILKFLSHEIGDQFKLLTEQIPSKAIKIIDEYTSKSIISNFLTPYGEDDIQHEHTSMVQFDFSKVIEIANNPARYNMLGVIISDHMMPEMTGIELCKRLKNKMVKKILLTGKADEHRVLEAFNWGVINRYVKKKDANSIDELKNYIHDMVLQYFIELSDHLKLMSSKLAILSDTKFVSFFNKIMHEYNIREYYLIDKNGSYLLIDKNGKKSVLSIATDDDLDGFSQFYADEPKVEKYVKQIRHRQNIPFFGIGVNPTKAPLSNWENYLFKANLLKCDNKTLYWSICSC